MSLSDGHWSRDLTAHAGPVGCKDAGQLAALWGVCVCLHAFLYACLNFGMSTFAFMHFFFFLCMCVFQRGRPLGREISSAQHTCGSLDYIRAEGCCKRRREDDEERDGGRREGRKGGC